MSTPAHRASALHERMSSDTTVVAPQREPTAPNERPKARAPERFDWSLAALISGTVTAMYIAAGVGIYVALHAFVL